MRLDRLENAATVVGGERYRCSHIFFTSPTVTCPYLDIVCTLTNLGMAAT